jgi:cellulose synthase (UDP-forming)
LTVLVNLLWTLYNLIILGGAIAIAQETKQVRRTHRVTTTFPVMLRLKSGHIFKATLRDFSLGGVRIDMPSELAKRFPFNVNDELHVILSRGGDKYGFAAKIINTQNGSLRLEFFEMTVQQRIDYVQCTFARADIWSRWQQDYRQDKPMTSFLQVCLSGIKGYGRIATNIGNLSIFGYRPILSMAKFLFTFKPQVVTLRDVDY